MTAIDQREQVPFYVSEFCARVLGSLEFNYYVFNAFIPFLPSYICVCRTDGVARIFTSLFSPVTSHLFPGLLQARGGRGARGGSAQSGLPERIGALKIFGRVQI